MQKPWINYHHLYYFKVIATEGGVAKAAKKLRLGQPTLSTQIKQFESVLGYELFNRTKKHLQITEAGKLVLNYANEIFRLGDEMLDALSDNLATSRIQVQIGAMDTVPKHMIAKVMEFAQEEYDCSISIREGHGDQLLRELRAHQIDLLIANHPPPVSDKSSFFAKNICKMPVVVCASPEFSKLKKDFPRSLHQQPAVMPSLQSKLRHDVDHFFRLNDIHLQIVAEVQDTSLQTMLGTQGRGIIPIAEPAIADLKSDKSLIVLGTLPQVYEELWFIAAERKLQNPVAATIMRHFRLDLGKK